VLQRASALVASVLQTSFALFFKVTSPLWTKDGHNGKLTHLVWFGGQSPPNATSPEPFRGHRGL
jgi:hypothetical protein